MPDIHGRIGVWNKRQKHVNTLTRKQVIECLKIVLDPDRFQFVPHWQNHITRKEKAELHLARVKKHKKFVPYAKAFLKSLCQNDPFFECDAFLAVGDYQEVFHFADQKMAPEARAERIARSKRDEAKRRGKNG